jgi:hypothetical protein
MITHIELAIVILLLIPWAQWKRSWRTWSDNRKVETEHKERQKMRQAIEQEKHHEQAS